MKRITSIFLGMTGLAIMFAVSPMAAVAQTGESALLARIEALEAELADQRADFVSYRLGGGAAQSDDGSKGCGKGNDCGPSRSVYASYDVTILRPYISDVQAGHGFDNEYGFGHRFVLGAENSNGVGARIRYWMYNHGHEGVAGLAGLQVGIDMDAVDLDATIRKRLCDWELLLSGGVRYGRVGFTANGAPEVYFEGTGPTIALEALQHVGCRGMYLVGNFRTSMLIGEASNVPVGGGGFADDEITTVLEGQLGVGVTREMGRAALDLRCLWETQFWMNDSFADDVFGFGSNLALSGVTVSAQVRL